MPSAAMITPQKICVISARRHCIQVSGRRSIRAAIRPVPRAAVAPGGAAEWPEAPADMASRIGVAFLFACTGQDICRMTSLDPPPSTWKRYHPFRCVMPLFLHIWNVLYASLLSPSPCGRGLGGGGQRHEASVPLAPSPQPPPARGGGEQHRPARTSPDLRAGAVAAAGRFAHSCPTFLSIWSIAHERCRESRPHAGCGGVEPVSPTPARRRCISSPRSTRSRACAACWACSRAW